SLGPVDLRPLVVAAPDRAAAGVEGALGPVGETGKERRRVVDVDVTGAAGGQWALGHERPQVTQDRLDLANPEAAQVDQMRGEVPQRPAPGFGADLAPANRRSWIVEAAVEVVHVHVIDLAQLAGPDQVAHEPGGRDVAVAEVDARPPSGA